MLVFCHFFCTFDADFSTIFLHMTITPQLDTRGKGPYYAIVIYVYHNYKKRFIQTGFKIEAKYWGDKKVVKHPDAAIINSRISNLINDANAYYAECRLKGRPVNLDMIGRERKSYSFNDYLLHRAAQYEKSEMIIMMRKARRMDRELRLFVNPDLTEKEIKLAEGKKEPLPGKHVYFDDITPDFVREYDTWLIGRGNGNNTRRLKMEFAGHWYKDAIKDGQARDPNHFREYRIPETEVKKPKLSFSDIQAIEKLELADGPVNDARNLFLFSYYCKGARFEMCVTRKKADIQEGRIHFVTNKAIRHMSVKIHSRLQRIIDYYKNVPGEYILPYYRPVNNKKAHVELIGSLNATVNKNLKIVAVLAGIKINLTVHIARHSFAFHLKHTSATLHVIKDTLRHSRSDTTEKYLRALDDEVLDEEVGKVYWA